MRDKVWLTDVDGYKSNKRRVDLGDKVIFTKHGYYDLHADGIYRRSEKQPALSKHDMD